MTEKEFKAESQFNLCLEISESLRKRIEKLEDKVESLQKGVTTLKRKNPSIKKSVDFPKEFSELIAKNFELSLQVEKMKRCQNCKNYYKKEQEICEFTWVCKFYDKWELAE